MKTKIVFLTMLALAACGGTVPVENAQPMALPDSVVWNGDADLAPLLRRPLVTPAHWAEAERIELRIGMNDFADRLGGIVEDTTAPWLVRMNAIRVLENRRAGGQIGAFSVAMKSPDERVRIATVTAMREFTDNWSSARQILERGLNDPSRRVQSAALQVLADRDVPMLRSYLARTKNVELRGIALDLIRAAEERGMALVPSGPNEVLERTTGTVSGAKLTFSPTRRYENWDAAVGDLIIALPKGQPVTVATGVEAVGNVVPAFFTPDGVSLVYEVNREIHSRNLATGADVKLADGIAPRILPFTNDALYFVEVRDKRTQTPNGFGLRYDVYRVPAAGGTPVVIGQVGGSMKNNVHGNYSSARWSRVDQLAGHFYLVGDGISLRLPSPFAKAN